VTIKSYHFDSFLPSLTIKGPKQYNPQWVKGEASLTLTDGNVAIYGVNDLASILLHVTQRSNFDEIVDLPPMI